ncbi:MAG: hypothetical protein GX335_01105, partial [Firmicutes bacterium]|nr:hypothetical protein [Bacillota bacterium]
MKSLRFLWFLVILLVVISSAGAGAKDYIEIWPQGWSEVKPLFSTSIFADRFSVEHDSFGTSTLTVDGLYFRELDLTYRLIRDSVIEEELVLVEKGELDNPYLGLDDLGNRHLFWLDRSGEKNTLNYTMLTVPGGEFEQHIFWETQNTIQDLAVVQDGENSHLVWSERDPYFQIKYARLEKGRLAEDVTITEGVDLSIRPSIVLDSQGRPHIAWYETTPVAVRVFYSKRENGGWTKPLQIGNGSVQDIQQGGTIAMTAWGGQIYLAWASTPRDSNHLFVNLARAGGGEMAPQVLDQGSRPRFVEGARSLQLVWQGTGRFGAQIHHGVWEEGALVEKTNLTVGRKMAFRPEVVTQDEFLYVYWLQADPDRGYRLFEINNQFPKKI